MHCMEPRQRSAFLIASVFVSAICIAVGLGRVHPRPDTVTSSVGPSSPPANPAASSDTKTEIYLYGPTVFVGPRLDEVEASLVGRSLYLLDTTSPARSIELR